MRQPNHFPLKNVIMHLSNHFPPFFPLYKKDGNIFVDPSPYTVNLLIAYDGNILYLFPLNHSLLFLLKVVHVHALGGEEGVLLLLKKKKSKCNSTHTLHPLLLGGI